MKNSAVLCAAHHCHRLLLSAVVYWCYHHNLALREQQRDQDAGIENFSVKWKWIFRGQQ